MAIYEDGKTRFDFKFINQFKCKGVRSFLKSKRYSIVDNYKDNLCTVEHWLYNRTINEIREDVYNYLCGYYKQGPTNYEKVMVHSIVNTDNLINVLKEVRRQMFKENNWEEEN